MQQHNLHVSQAGSMFLFHGACSVWVGARAVAAEAVCWPCNAVIHQHASVGSVHTQAAGQQVIAAVQAQTAILFDVLESSATG